MMAQLANLAHASTHILVWVLVGALAALIPIQLPAYGVVKCTPGRSETGFWLWIGHRLECEPVDGRSLSFFCKSTFPIKINKS